MVIHQDKTVDITQTFRISSLDLSTYCTDDSDNDDKSYEVQTTIVNDMCVSKAIGLTLADVNQEEKIITHSDNEYSVKLDVSFLSLLSFYNDDMDSSLSITFPGKVTHADPKGKIDGNTVTWTDVHSFDQVKATGKDSSGSIVLWIALGLVLLLVVAGIVLAIVLVSRSSKKKAALAGVPAGAYTSAAPYPAQPGQVPPQGHQPGVPPQPGYPPQPGVPPQPGYPPQPPAGHQPPQNPSGPY